MSRRTILKMLLLLAAGAVLNVAVAWGCVVHSYNDLQAPRPMGREIPPDAEDMNWWTQRALPGMVRPHVVTQVVNVGFVERRLAGDAGLIPNMQPPTTLVEQSARLQSGWPSISLHGEWFSVLMPQNPRGFGQIHRNSLDLKKYSLASTLRTPCLPLAPLWPGFAINTVFYAGVLWMLCCGPFALRRMIRRRRGLCAICAYPIGSSDVCTECGAAV